MQFTPHGPVSIHIVRGPRPVGLYRLKPVLSNDSVVLRETVSSMERRLSTQATTVGVNGDYFSPSDGRPSGIFLRDGVLATPPNAARSSAGVTLDGLARRPQGQVLRHLAGNGTAPRADVLNKAPGTNGISLFTSRLGYARRRASPGAFAAVILAPFPAATPNADLAVPVTVRVRQRVRSHRARDRRARRPRKRGGEAPGRGGCRERS